MEIQYNSKGIVFSEENERYEIQDESDVLVFTPVLNVIKEYDPNDFTMFLLYNENAGENSIFQVKCDKSARVGWMFPIQALLSNAHEYCDNEHFLKQAYVAYYLLLDNIKERAVSESDGEVLLQSLYDDELQILLLEKSLLKSENIDFTFHRYAPSLLAKGYSLKKVCVKSTSFQSIQTYLKIDKISDELVNNTYINTLFEELIPSDFDSLSKFHVLYQAIEVMIAAIFEEDFKNFLDNLTSSGKISFLNEKEEELKDMMGESQRITRLVTDMTKVTGANETNLKNACKDLCNSVGFPIKKDNLAKTLYGCRCLLVHNMYRLGEDERKKIGEINVFFVDVLVDMVNSFLYKRKAS